MIHHVYHRHIIDLCTNLDSNYRFKLFVPNTNQTNRFLCDNRIHSNQCTDYLPVIDDLSNRKSVLQFFELFIGITSIIGYKYAIAKKTHVWV